jgi:hypothetical protein
MNRTITVLSASALVLLVGVFVAAGPLSAHHGRASTYDGSKDITVKGTVTEWAWRNPHVVIYMDAKDANGKVQNWAFEGQNTSMLSHNDGLHRNSLKPGQEITVIASPARNGSPFGVIKKVILADGKAIMVFGAGANGI